LANYDYYISRDDLLSELIVTLNDWIKRWDNGNNFSEIRDAWCKKAAPVGAPLSVRVGKDRIEGKFAGLDEKGALKLELQDKSIKLITGGELL